ncbi:unnamed protein product [Oncorhynchus mykiss]|uniref:Uncharacterized protein n=1 Tax=Oncorhynchus mykiss TaxID=8022 RepID=A0A060Y0H5_ONCMY|nr:unnamed protein product [Oncorhynchus mykiss]
MVHSDPVYLTKPIPQTIQALTGLLTSHQETAIMSWFRSTQLSSFAKQALTTAQKSIDRVLDIKEDEWGDTVIMPYGGELHGVMNIQMLSVPPTGGYRRRMMRTGRLWLRTMWTLTSQG